MSASADTAAALASQPDTGLHPSLDPVWEAVVKVTRLKMAGFRENCRPPGMSARDEAAAFDEVQQELRARRQRAYAVLVQISDGLARRAAQAASMPTSDPGIQAREASAELEVRKLRAHVARLRREIQEKDGALDRLQGDLGTANPGRQEFPASLGRGTRGWDEHATLLHRDER